MTTTILTAPLPGPLADAVVSNRSAAVRAALLAERAESGTLSDLDADSLAHAEEIMVGMWVKLAKAGRLDLIGGA